jgi:hypothetical protein
VTVAPGARDLERARATYLWLLKQILTNTIYRDESYAPMSDDQVQEFDLGRRTGGWDWPLRAHTMVGLLRLDHLQACVESVLQDGVPGDLIETGVWRGGASILMRGMLEIYGDEHRRVWVADSFAGLPAPDVERYPLDKSLDLSTFAALSVSLAEVKENFSRYGLLDDRVRFLEGWFRDTLATAPIDRLAVMRLDGDLYESTMEALTALYPRLSIGGYVIIDDYSATLQSRQAVADFRERFGVSEEIGFPDPVSAYWRRMR